MSLRQRLMLSFGCALVAVAICLVGWLGWQNWGTDYLAKGTHAKAISRLKSDWSKGKSDLPAATQGGAYTGSLGGDDVSESSLAQGQPFGLLYIPRFGKNYVEPIIEATSLNQLADGVGHGIGTAMPGQLGNVGIAGHRTTWGHPFRDIDKLKAGDKLEIDTAHDTYTYVVTGHQVVSPSDVAVWDPVPGHPHARATQRLLTLSACTPLYSAAQRYIVYAKQTGHTTH